MERFNSKRDETIKEIIEKITLSNLRLNVSSYAFLEGNYFITELNYFCSTLAKVIEDLVMRQSANKYDPMTGYRYQPSKGFGMFPVKMRESLIAGLQTIGRSLMEHGVSVRYWSHFFKEFALLYTADDNDMDHIVVRSVYESMFYYEILERVCWVQDDDEFFKLGKNSKREFHSNALFKGVTFGHMINTETGILAIFCSVESGESLNYNFFCFKSGRLVEYAITQVDAKFDLREMIRKL